MTIIKSNGSHVINVGLIEFLGRLIEFLGRLDGMECNCMEGVT